MARWIAREPPRVEAPAWYRTFDPAAWDEPDAQEEAMISGSRCTLAEWPAQLREIHARRRWAAAQHAYRQEHPDLAEQELAEIVTRARRERGA